MKRPQFTEQELNDVTNYSKWGNRNRLLLLMTHMTGIRRNELAALCIGDIVTINGEITTAIQLKSDRLLVVSGRLQQELKKYIAAQFELDRLAGIAYTYGHLPLFFTQKRNAFTPTTLTQTFTKICERAGL